MLAHRRLRKSAMPATSPPIAPVLLGLTTALALALAACAAPEPAGGKSKGMGGGMMEEHCRKLAADPAQAASAPEMMRKHCKLPGDPASGAASAAGHVH